MRPYVEACRTCIQWKRSVGEFGVCWHPEREHVITHEDGRCDGHARKVIRVSDLSGQAMPVASTILAQHGDITG